MGLKISVIQIEMGWPYCPATLIMGFDLILPRKNKWLIGALLLDIFPLIFLQTRKLYSSITNSVGPFQAPPC